MKITLKAWIIFFILALIGIGVWIKLSLPQFTSVDLSIDRKFALKRADQVLKEKGIDTSRFNRSIIFVSDSDADRYLQKTLGFKKEEDFLKAHNYNLFSWAIRFYQENRKEEYGLHVSSKSGEVVYFRHAIEDTESRLTLPKEIAKQRVQGFLSKNFKIDFRDFDFHEEQVKKYDKRTDYGFSWEKKGVYLPWDKSKDAGGAKLLTGATISGEEIVGFSYLRLDIPEKFSRLLQNQLSKGALLTAISMFLYLMWVALAVVIIIRRRNSFLMYLSKNFFIAIGISIFVLNLIGIINDFQEVLFGYDTGYSFKSYIGYYVINVIVNLIFATVTLVIPAIAGESLRFDAFPKKSYCSFMHYLTSSFFSRKIAKFACLGYLIFLIMLGLQSLIFHLGQRFLGVWVEHTRLTELSTSYLPFLGALIVGYRASLNEEIIFRIFGISWVKKYLKSSILAAILVSLIWGFGHSQYQVFPIWFRGIEVGAMGLVLAFLFLRYGIICLIVAHYLFDVFWGVASYLIGKSNVYLFGSSIFILALPLIFALIAYFKNQPDVEKEVESVLDKHQRYNLQILICFIRERIKKGANKEVLKKELVSHGWDSALVELALKEINNFKN